MRTLVVAPHPDDEVLGPGGTLLKRKSAGGEIAWVLMTQNSNSRKEQEEEYISRNAEILAIKKSLEIDSFIELEYETTKLDQVPFSELVFKIAEAYKTFRPTEILLPHFSDIHSDHKVTYQAAISASKWFRSPSIKRILLYETLSETNFENSTTTTFHPNYYVDITPVFDSKIELCNIYKTEILNHPFPRSISSIAALATLRGSESGFQKAEAFQLIREFEN